MKPQRASRSRTQGSFDVGIAAIVLRPLPILLSKIILPLCCYGTSYKSHWRHGHAKRGLDNVPDVLCSMAKLAARYTGAQAKVADTD